MKNGITLIETIIYLALISIIMVGILSSIYVLIGSGERQKEKNLEDTELILKNYHG